MTPSHEPGSVPGEPIPPRVLAAVDAPSVALSVDRDRGRPDWRFLLRSPWHLIALGFGSGLPRIAPGTWGTVFAWVSFAVLDRWLNDTQWAGLIGVMFVLGAIASQRTGMRLGIIDSGHIVIDEIVAFWTVLVMLPDQAPGWMPAAAFVLFRIFDIAKPAPIKRLDARIKNGFGVMVDDVVAAFYTLLVVAVFWRLARG
jgi:phosphatidylglycerophosphatase A